MSDRHLHGLFEPTASGRENINPLAWARNKRFSPSSPFPAQVEFKLVHKFEPLAESAFRHVFTDGNRIRKLDADQVGTPPETHTPPLVLHFCLSLESFLLSFFVHT